MRNPVKRREKRAYLKGVVESAATWRPAPRSPFGQERFESNDALSELLSLIRSTDALKTLHEMLQEVKA